MNIISDTIQSLTSMRQRQVLIFISFSNSLAPAQCCRDVHGRISGTAPHVTFNLQFVHYFVCCGLLWDGPPWKIEADISIEFTLGLQLAHQVINLGLIVTSALMIWKSLMVVTNSESPVVVVLRFEALQAV
jgi:hypothetical protein